MPRLASRQRAVFSRLTAAIRGAVAQTRRLLRPLLSWEVLRNGLSGAAVALVAIIGLIVVLIKVADAGDRGASEVRGIAEVAANRFGCALQPGVGINATRCVRIGRRLVRVTFSSSLLGSTAIVSRGACCPGATAASIVSDHDVMVAFPRLGRREARASVVIP